MVVERHFNKDGMPAYVLVFREREGEPREFMRLVYPSATEFTRLWNRSE